MTRRPFLSLNSVKLIGGSGAAACDLPAGAVVFLLCAKVVAGAIRATIRNVAGRVLSLIVTFSFFEILRIGWRTPDFRMAEPNPGASRFLLSSKESLGVFYRSRIEKQVSKRFLP